MIDLQMMDLAARSSAPTQEGNHVQAVEGDKNGGSSVENPVQVVVDAVSHVFSPGKILKRQPSLKLR